VRWWRQPPLSPYNGSRRAEVATAHRIGKEIADGYDRMHYPRHLRAWVAGAFALAILSVLFGTASSGRAGKVESSHRRHDWLDRESQNKKEVRRRDTLKAFIKEETGLANEILPPTDWQKLGDKLAKASCTSVSSRL